ncbi:MAG: hypothetical protein P8Y03_13850 [Anaerolineales bacterium]
MMTNLPLRMIILNLLIVVLVSGCAGHTLPNQVPTPSIETTPAEPRKLEVTITRTSPPKTITQERTMPGPSQSPESRSENPLVRQAKEDLAQRLNVPIEEIELLQYKEVVWPDSSLGCPEPDMTYEQVPQDGALIRLGVERRMYFYHSGGAQAPFFCENTSSIIPKITPKYDEFVPPPDHEID